MDSINQLIDTENVLIAYIETALWSSCDDEDEPMNRNHTNKDIHPDTLSRMRRDVTEFVNANYTDLASWVGCTSAEQQSGHDLWLTRNGHGAGFWEDEWDGPGSILTRAAEAMGTFDLYIGDDGKIHGI